MTARSERSIVLVEPVTKRGTGAGWEIDLMGVASTAGRMFRDPGAGMPPSRWILAPSYEHMPTAGGWLGPGYA